jgi:hypothetical protein
VRIYEHVLEEGWVKPGDYVVDCFSGIGGFALEAMRHGLNFIGVELEQRFCDMGQGCDCTGISKADWVRFQGRWDKARYRDGRHWCPQCVMKASMVADERKFKLLPLPGTKWAARIALVRPGRQATLFDAAPSASYVRNSGKIPCTEAHHYRGNVETWAAQGMPGTAVIVQGDSRRLGEVLATAQLALSSPPYAGTLRGSLSQSEGDKEHNIGRGRNPSSPGAHFPHGYSADPQNLGNLPDTGFEAALALGSPPYSPHGVGHDAGHPRLDAIEDNRRSEEGSGRRPAYGTQPGQLAQMPEGDLALAISSPPFIQVMKGQKASDKGRESRARRFAQGKFKAKRPDCFSSTANIGHAAMDAAAYGDSDGQLAALPEGDHAEACERPQCCISSPPYATSPIAHCESGSVAQRWRDTGTTLRQRSGGKLPSEQYGEGEPAQLAQMPPGDHAAALEAGAETGGAELCLSSPPYEASVNSGRDGIDFAKAGRPDKMVKTGAMHYPIGAGADRDYRYGNTEGQIGKETGSTFWAASREILEQVYRILAPGTHAIFVCKRFVRNKKIVEFPTQWAHLCEAVGFKWIHHHKAWLVEDRGAQHTLEGGLERRIIRRFSFFRLLHFHKFPKLAIEYEDVLCFVKPL